MSDYDRGYYTGCVIGALGMFLVCLILGWYQVTFYVP